MVGLESRVITWQRTRRWTGWSAWWLSLLLLAAIVVLQLWWPVIATPINYAPVWAWLPGGLALSVFAWLMIPRGGAARTSRDAGAEGGDGQTGDVGGDDHAGRARSDGRRQGGVMRSVRLVGAGSWLCVAWAVTVAVLADETMSLVRGGLAQWRGQEAVAGPAAMQREEGVIRVVSLNTEVSTLEAVEDALELEPDVLLLQECNSVWSITETISQRWGDSFEHVWSRDPAIFVRGTIEPGHEFDPRADRRWVKGEARLHSGERLRVVSLRLHSVSRRHDFWTRGFWDEHATDAALRERQLRAVAAFAVNTAEPGMPVIVGGDFNAPARHRMFDHFRPRLRDPVREAGVGLPNTYHRDWPVVRIDRLWISDHFEPIKVRTHRTSHSNHLMVVADLRKVNPAR